MLAEYTKSTFSPYVFIRTNHIVERVEGLVGIISPIVSTMGKYSKAQADIKDWIDKGK